MFEATIDHEASSQSTGPAAMETSHLPSTISSVQQQEVPHSLISNSSANSMGAQDVVDSTELVAGEPSIKTFNAPTSTSPGIDNVTREELIRLVAATLNNPRFWAKESRVVALKNAAVLPVFDDRALQQFFNHAMDVLIAKAARESSRSGKPAVMPTEEDGKSMAWQKYEAKRKAEIKREYKKKNLPISKDDLDAQVLGEVARLREQENAA